MNPQDRDVISLAEHIGTHLGESCAGVETVADRRGAISSLPTDPATTRESR